MVDFKAVKTGVLGIAGIAIILLILLLIFGNLSGNLGFTQDSSSTAVQQLTLANNSVVTLTGTSGRTNPSVSSVIVVNATGGKVITSGNYTLTGTTITGSPAMTLAYNGSSVNVSYVTSYDSDNQISSTSLIGNVTDGATSLASKFSTVFVLLGVLLILAVVFTIVKMFGLGGKKGLIE